MYDGIRISQCNHSLEWSRYAAASYKILGELQQVSATRTRSGHVLQYLEAELRYLEAIAYFYQAEECREASLKHSQERKKRRHLLDKSASRVRRAQRIFWKIKTQNPKLKDFLVTRVIELLEFKKLIHDEVSCETQRVKTEIKQVEESLRQAEGSAHLTERFYAGN
ncbi:hypothetical protein ABW19_dt0210385 [Dactylella cylindrospora]|nr:hypothetical protein ABW19_dt0210385 [Dactylella cylindrospora]